MPEPYVWSALAPAEARDLFAPFARPWWIAGGWAIDLHMGRETRLHEDIDLAILRGDEVEMARMLPGWDICVAHDGNLTPWPADRPLEMPFHQFWVRGETGGPWTFEVLLEDHDGADIWRYRRDHRITLPLADFGRVSSEGIPYIAPEIALFYKSNRHATEKNAADFAAALPTLTANARAWLRTALEAIDAHHPWLPLLI